MAKSKNKKSRKKTQKRPFNSFPTVFFFIPSFKFTSIKTFLFSLGDCRTHSVAWNPYFRVSFFFATKSGVGNNFSRAPYIILTKGRTKKLRTHQHQINLFFPIMNTFKGLSFIYSRCLRNPYGGRSSLWVHTQNPTDPFAIKFHKTSSPFRLVLRYFGITYCPTKKFG